jgi:hypothetical protein
MGVGIMTGGTDIRTPSQQTPGASVKWPLVGKIVSLQSVIRLYKENPGNSRAGAAKYTHNNARPTRAGNREVASWR